MNLEAINIAKNELAYIDECLMYEVEDGLYYCNLPRIEGIGFYNIHMLYTMFCKNKGDFTNDQCLEVIQTCIERYSKISSELRDFQNVSDFLKPKVYIRKDELLHLRDFLIAILFILEESGR